MSFKGCTRDFKLIKLICLLPQPLKIEKKNIQTFILFDVKQWFTWPVDLIAASLQNLIRKLSMFFANSKSIINTANRAYSSTVCQNEFPQKWGYLVQSDTRCVLPRRCEMSPTAASYLKEIIYILRFTKLNPRMKRSCQGFFRKFILVVLYVVVSQWIPQFTY